MTNQHTYTRLAYSIGESAGLLGVSRGLLYRLLARGELRAVRIGARQRIAATELERLLGRRV